LSLLLRVGNSEDQIAWGEFVELYYPVIYRTARYKGLQDADAEDVSQQVLVSVAKALQQRPHDPDRAKFRTWLATVTRNATLNLLRGRRPDRGLGDSEIQNQLNAIQDRSDDEEIIDREYQKELFRAAAKRIESEFEKETWEAFWRTTIEGQPIDQVASQLGKQVGSIYAARSRVIRRLREEISLYQLSEHDEKLDDSTAS